MGKLEGRVALVTGASRGLGRGIAVAFAREGAQVAINYKSSEGAAAEVVSAIKNGGGRAFSFRADVTREQEVKELVSAVAQAWGTIDILVNNAGIVTSAAITDMPTSMWDDVFSVHVRAMFLCSRAVLPYMLRQGHGKIINMSGSFGISGLENFVHLSAAKGAMTGFTRALAREVGPKGICVNCIAPSMIEGETTAKMKPELLEVLRQRYPLRKLGAIQDVAATAMFLASSDSDFYTGQTLAPTGGEVMV